MKNYTIAPQTTISYAPLDVLVGPTSAHITNTSWILEVNHVFLLAIALIIMDTNVLTYQLVEFMCLVM